MKKLFSFTKAKFIGILSVILLTPFLLVSQPTQEEIQQSIDDGLEWLVAQQDPSGYWDAYYGELEAGTGLALTKLCERAYELNYESPFDPAYPYSQNVIDGFDWLFDQLTIVPISPQDHTTGATGTIDDPDVNANGTGVCALFNSYRETYASGILLTAIAASGTPTRVVNVPTSEVDGWTFADVAQDMVDFFAFGQVEYPVPGIEKEGGWEYFHMDNGAYGSGWMGDQSNTGYAVLGIALAQKFGATIPDWVKIELNEFIDLVQDDVDDPVQPNDGGSWYSYPGDFIQINTLKTGNLLTEMALVGDVPSTQRVVDAIDYIERHWYDAGGGNQPPGWNGNPYGTAPAQYQAMFCLMKGLVYIGIDEFGGINWFDDIATVILDQQEDTPGPNFGSWQNSSGRGEPVIITIWALLTLEKRILPPPVVYVDFDVHPTSWPNPINTNSNGKTPAAILGAEDFDVTTIDPATLLLEGVSPVSWAYEDVTQPAGNEWECNDTEEAGDGYMDLTLKFMTQELVAALGEEVNDGDELIITIVGNLVDDGLAIEGDDCIWIKKKGIKAAELDAPTSFALAQNYPNPFSSTTTIEFQLPEDTYVMLKVYDMMGNEIATIVDNSYTAGYYSFEFDAAHLVNGIYIYKMVTSDHTTTKQMLLSY